MHLLALRAWKYLHIVYISIILCTYCVVENHCCMSVYVCTIVTANQPYFVHFNIGNWLHLCTDLLPSCLKQLIAMHAGNTVFRRYALTLPVAALIPVLLVSLQLTQIIWYKWRSKQKSWRQRIIISKEGAWHCIKVCCNHCVLMYSEARIQTHIS